MVKTRLVFSDGTEISSGVNQKNAIQRVSIEEKVNDADDLTFGAVCAKMISLSIITPNNEFSCNADDEIIVYQEDENGAVRKKGHFIADKPLKINANTTQIVAFDNVIKLDKDLTSWLNSLNGYPYRLFQFAKMICAECGLNLATTSIANGDIPVERFEADGVTGRQLMRWIGEASGNFCIANENGDIEFSWFKSNSTKITFDRRSDSITYFGGGLSYEDYEVSSVERVQIRQKSDDVGVVYPSDIDEGNTYVIEGNPLLTAFSESSLLFVAQNLYLKTKDIRYVPCKVSVPVSFTYEAGDIVEIIDRNGKTFFSYITSKRTDGQKESLESVGNYKRNGATTLYNASYKSISGKNFSLQTSIDGLKAINEDLSGKFSELKLTVDGVSTTVSDAEKNITALQQTAGTVSVKASSEQGTLTTVIDNSGTWETKYVDANGRVLSGISFDFLLGAFVFNGTGSFTGELNIGDGNFIVDVNGNVTAQGDTKIFGGKYYAMDDDGDGNYTTMDEEGFSVYSSDAVQRIKVGFPSRHPESPFFVMNGGTTDSASRVIMKQFSNGLWLGNDKPIDKYGEFVTEKGYNGIFISLSDAQTYVVHDLDMQSVYTGETIARFG